MSTHSPVRPRSKAPETPRGHAHNAINEIIQSLAVEFGLPLAVRETWSPSTRSRTNEEECKSLIQFLYFQNRTGLEQCLGEFRENARTGPLNHATKLLSELVGDLRDLKYITASAPAGRSLRERLSSVSSVQAVPALKESAMGSTPVHVNSRRKIPWKSRIKVDCPTPSTTSPAGSDTTVPFSGTADDETFETPPQSPVLARKTSELHTIQQTSLDGATKESFTNSISFKNMKRSSDESLNHYNDTKHPRLSSDDVVLTSRSSQRRKKASDSFVSIVSKTRSATASSFYTVDRSTTSTAPTSFSANLSASMCLRDAGQEPRSSGGYSIDVAADELIAAADSFNADTRSDGPSERASRDYSRYVEFPQPLVKESLSQYIESQPVFSSPARQPLAATPYEAMPSDQLQSELEQTVVSGVDAACSWNKSYNLRRKGEQVSIGKGTSTESKTDDYEQGQSEHHQIRDLPKQDFFAASLPNTLKTLPFALQWECLRVMEYYKGGSTVETPQLDLVEDRRTDGPMFALRLEPLRTELSNVMQRKFGAHRYLCLNIPDLRRLPAPYKKQDQRLRNRLGQWMCSDKHLLGRTWRAFYLKLISGKKNGRRKNESTAQQVWFFATDGWDIPKMSIGEMLDWAIPFEQNKKQPYCKAFTRIELFLSKTCPTIVFSTQQVRHVCDISADGAPESVEFNDLTLHFADPYDPRAPRVMNDGCARISAGAAKLVCQKLGKETPRPVAFQGRINGAKGMWVVSAPYDSKDQDHQDVWIEISSSQRKVVPRPEDLDPKTCEQGRWTLEVVKHSHYPRTSELAVDFVPILEHRGVSRQTLQRFVKDHIMCDAKQLLDSLRNPKLLRCWLNSWNDWLDEDNRERGLAWQAGLPLSMLERTILLLESGFDPQKCQYLAQCVKFVAERWGYRMTQRLKIRVGRSTYLFGIADPTGCLRPGEIHLAFSSSFCDEQTGDSWSVLRDVEVLVTRHPTLRASDMQKVKAVYKEELSYLTDVVVFPTKGSYPLAGKLQGGDYDGDTFWICWDQTLTGPFKNAPPPLADPNLEAFGIHIDTDTLESTLEDDASAARWLEKSFAFRNRTDLLGSVTTDWSSLAYLENDISHPGVVSLADLHDLLIDSAKNGYIFAEEAFRAYKKQSPDIKHMSLTKPAYKKFAEHEKTQSERNKSSPLTSVAKTYEYKPDHIVDYIVFKVVLPLMIKTMKDVQMALATAQHGDVELENPYLPRRGRTLIGNVDSVSNAGTSTEARELYHLRQEFKKIQKDWGLGLNGKDHASSDTYNTTLAHCYQNFVDLKPQNVTHELVSEWLVRDAINSPTRWELIKASALFVEYPRCRNSTFVFHLAGRELCWLKAHSSEHTRGLVAAMYNIMKPRKEKRGLDLEPEEDREEFELDDDLFDEIEIED
ncbi:hypothetical protein LTR66_006778 [Elasticomyces elasticus]|nr:hypothetical protein LTR66_006778 [Elasticomyces elasticus]